MMIVMIMMVMIKRTTCLWMSPALATSILFKITLLFIESFFGGDAGSRRRVSGNSSSSNSIISTSSSEKLLLALVLAARPFLGGLNWATILVSTCSWGEQKYNSFEELTFRLIYLTHEIWRKPTINGHTSSSKLEVMLLRALAAADLGEGIFDFGLVRLVDGKEVGPCLEFWRKEVDLRRSFSQGLMTTAQKLSMTSILCNCQLGRDLWWKWKCNFNWN